MEISSLITTENVGPDCGFSLVHVPSTIRVADPIGFGLPRWQRRNGHKTSIGSGKVTPYKCDECFAKFSGRSHLLVHVQTVHRGLRPHSCKHCGRSFGTKGTMNRHIRIVHLRERNFVCPLCKRAFSTLACLKRHANVRFACSRNRLE
mmetsp:Transcript_22338/g.89920  ORF Transcript_22338/g.89920 Transcript_22338/m.89920 type:complete len:148 (-) Transcript_22338:114-557(-)